jgi:type IV secretion system protein VirB6
MVLVMKVAGTMVSGWTVFGLARQPSAERAEAASPAPVRAIAASAAGVAVDQARVAAAPAPSRQIRMAGGAPLAANDSGPATAVRRETRLVGSGSSESAAASSQSQSRARGVGVRFRAAPVRRSEKVK